MVNLHSEFDQYRVLIDIPVHERSAMQTHCGSLGLQHCHVDLPGPMGFLLGTQYSEHCYGCLHPCPSHTGHSSLADGQEAEDIPYTAFRSRGSVSSPPFVIAMNLHESNIALPVYVVSLFDEPYSSLA